MKKNKRNRIGEEYDSERLEDQLVILSQVKAARELIDKEINPINHKELIKLK